MFFKIVLEPFKHTVNEHKVNTDRYENLWSIQKKTKSAKHTEKILRFVTVKVDSIISISYIGIQMI